ncbi:MAG: response regulator [Gammaproteobacteria bacterium]
MRVLLVEDDPCWAMLCRRGWRRLGLPLTGCVTGWRPHAWRTEPYAVVVLDLGLPRLSGLDLLRQRRNSNDSVPVLILTARDAIEDRVKGLDSGADDYLVKPFDMHELAARLQALTGVAGEASPVLQTGGAAGPAAHQVYYQGTLVELTTRIRRTA